MQIRVLDRTPGVGTAEWLGEFPGIRITLRELFEKRIRQEVDTYNRERPDVYRGLIQPEGAERVLNGYSMKQFREVDFEAQLQRAVAAFEANGIIVVAGDRQLESLDDEISLEATPEVDFFKLVPLVGG
ncbi:MAG TPA: hypothetical protein VE621_07415 [Bryobacteraceae bacterium]|jgi:hypothetical protein|nr:hypothetical protein [Bryobacteraceae bacterium]